MGDFQIAQAAHILETVERLDQALAHGTVVVGTKGEGRDLETRSVVTLEQFHHQLGGGMGMEIRRQIGEADAVMAVGLTIPQSRLGWRHAVDDIFSASSEQCSVLAIAQQYKRLDQRMAGPNIALQP